VEFSVLQWRLIERLIWEISFNNISDSNVKLVLYVLTIKNSRVSLKGKTLTVKAFSKKKTNVVSLMSILNRLYILK